MGDAKGSPPSSPPSSPPPSPGARPKSQPLNPWDDLGFKGDVNYRRLAGVLVPRSAPRSSSDQQWIERLANAYMNKAKLNQLAVHLRHSPQFTSTEVTQLMMKFPPSLMSIESDGTSAQKLYSVAVTIDFIMERIRGLEDVIRGLNEYSTSAELAALDEQIISADSRPWPCVDRYPNTHAYATDGHTNALEGQSAGSLEVFVENGADPKLPSTGLRNSTTDANLGGPVDGKAGKRKKCMFERWEDENFLLSFPLLDYITALSQGRSFGLNVKSVLSGQFGGVALDPRDENEAKKEEDVKSDEPTYWERIWAGVKVPRKQYKEHHGSMSYRMLTMKRGEDKPPTWNFESREKLYDHINQINAPSAKMMDAIVRCGVWAEIFQRYKNLSRLYSKVRAQSAANINTGSVLDAFGRGRFMQVKPPGPFGVECPADTYPVYYGYDGVHVPPKKAVHKVNGQKVLMTNRVDVNRTQCMPTVPVPDGSAFDARTRRVRRKRRSADDECLDAAAKRRAARARRRRARARAHAKKAKSAKCRVRHRKC